MCLGAGSMTWQDASSSSGNRESVWDLVGVLVAVNDLTNQTSFKTSLILPFPYLFHSINLHKGEDKSNKRMSGYPATNIPSTF